MTKVFTCHRGCGYTTKRQFDLQRHLNRKRKCTQITQNEANIASKEIHIDTQNSIFTTEEIHRDTQNNIFTEEEIHRDTQNNILRQETKDKKWICSYCSKPFSANCSMNRHMRLYCKVKKQREYELRQRNAFLEEQNLELLQRAQMQQQPTTSHTSGSHNHNTNHSHNTTNNINNYNINLPEGTWNRKLWGVMLFLISKTKGDRFSKGELEFNDAFGKTLSVAFHHPESPLYNSIQMLGRKEAWAKHNGKVVQKKKLLKKINKQHLDRLIQFIHEDNERFRTELPSVPVIEQWIQVNNDVIEHIKKYDPSDKTTIRESEEVFRSESLLNDFNSFVTEVAKNANMDRKIAFSQKA